MKKSFKSIPFGMRGKLLILITGIMLLLYVTTNLCIEFILQPYMSKITLMNVEQMERQRIEYFQDLQKRVEKAALSIIDDPLIQSSLERNLGSAEKTGLRRMLTATAGGFIKNILYIDNRGNHYNSSYLSSNIDGDTVKLLLKDKRMSEYYAIPIWNTEGSDSFSEKEQYLYASQNVRHINYNISCGKLFFSIYIGELDKLINTKSHESERVLLVNHNGEAAYPQNFTPADNAVVAGKYNSKQIVERSYTDKRTGWTMISYVAYADLMRSLSDLRAAVLSISTLVLIIGIAAIVIITHHYISPIKQIVTAMEQFSLTGKGRQIKEKIPGEIGQIGDTFNTMTEDIEKLLRAEKENQRALSLAELDSLTYQINPHFIYNTLDNIYMLSRMSGEERIGKLIDSLSKLLRISLSKGGNRIPLKNELEHVSSYLSIQQIRYEGLFEFEIIADKLELELPILKLILQPFAENSITHGFAGRQEGGKILVNAYCQEDQLVLRIEDNGVGIEPDIIDKYNSANKLTMGEIMSIFPNRQGGYGIGNVIARLNLYYGTNYQLSFINTGSGTICQISIPKKTSF